MTPGDYVVYDIKQIVLTDAYVAVWAHDEPDGSVTLRADPIAALAVAEKITRRRLPNGQASSDPEDRDVEAVVVGLDLMEGYFTVVDECTNFAGLCRKGEDISLATGCLRYEYSSRIKKQPAVVAG